MVHAHHPSDTVIQAPLSPTASPDAAFNLDMDEDMEPVNAQDQVPMESLGSEPVPVEVPSLDLPFKHEFTVLTDLSAHSLPVNSLGYQPVDVDRWELVLSPDKYLQRFKSTLATVQLISRAPHRKMHTTYHRGPGFDKWLLLAHANHQLWIDTRFKEAFFDYLDHYQTAQPGTLPLQASLGNVHISTSVFIHCLNQAGCDTIRLKAYGQKTPLLAQFLSKEPAQIDHRWAEHNEWDIGQSFSSSFIWLFASATGRRQGLQHYPMLVPGSGNYGTVNIKATHASRHYSIKIYPRLVHVIKSFNSRLQGSVPKTLQGIRNQAAASLRMVHNLASKDDIAVGGFRIEVTIRAPSLRQAYGLVKRTNFLNPSYWLGVGNGPHTAHILTAKLVTREGLLANANWTYQQAAQATIFNGQAADQPTRVQIQAIVDILNGLGWNPGIRSPTKSLDPDAWWHLTPSSDRSDIFRQLSARYHTDDDLKQLFEQARRSSHPYALPCKNQPGNPDHRYQIHSRTPFRVRCSNGQCRHKLQHTSLVHWIAELVQGGVIDRAALDV